MSLDFGIENIIKTRPNASNGLWVLFLLPFSIIMSALKNPFTATPTYKLTSLLCTGFLLTSFIITFHKYKRKRLKTLGLEIAFASLQITFLFKFYLNQDWIFSILSGLCCTLIYCKVYKFVLTKFENCFTFGEAGIVSQAAIILIYCTVINVLNLTQSNQLKSNTQISTLIIQLGLLGLATIAQLVHILNIKSAKWFYITTLIVIIFVIVLPLHILLNQNPLLWIFQQLFHDWSTIMLITYWIVCVGLAVLAVSYQVFYAQKASTGMRKVFHILAVVVFVPGLLHRCSLLYLSTGVVTGIFFALELLRIFQIPPLGYYLQNGFVVFSDEKDTGNLALTPIYLLVGSSLPLWFHPSPCDVTDSAMFSIVPLLSGVLSIGIGDTMASIIGSNYGKFHWPGSKKTIEGTIACILSQLGFVNLLLYMGYIENVNKELILKTYFSIFVTSLVEANTTQVDNLVLPLIMYILLV